MLITGGQCGGKCPGEGPCCRHEGVSSDRVVTVISPATGPGDCGIPPLPGRVFSKSIKLMLERQKFTLYQHETLLEKAKITPNQQDMLLGRNKSTL